MYAQPIYSVLMVRYLFGHSSILVLLTLVIFSLYSAHEILWSTVIPVGQTDVL